MEERRKHPMQILPECNEIFKRIEEKVDRLIEIDTRRNGKWDEHIKTSIDYRMKVENHETILSNIVELKRWWYGAVFTISLCIVSLAVGWGMAINQIKVNTEKINLIDGYHLDNGR